MKKKMISLESKIQLLDAIRTGTLYGITDLSAGDLSHLECAQRLVESGVQLVQYRGKALDLEQQRSELKILLPWARERGAWVIVNDFVHLAVELNADGVHLGQGDVKPERARELLLPEQVLGLSTHNISQVKQAEFLKVDYIGVGPAFLTLTKPQEPVAGLAFLKQASFSSPLPQVAIGGIKKENLQDVLATGQKTVAVISGLLHAESMPAQVKCLKHLLRTASVD